MDPNVKFSASDSSELADTSRYRKLVGSLIWLLNTRVDLSFSVGLLAGFMSQPRKTHWQAALRVLRYLKATPDLGLFYTRGGDNPVIVLQGWSDSDWAGDFDTRRSTTGYCFTLGSGAISWSSERQPTVALSSTEVEYRVVCATTCEAVWLR